MNYFEKLVSDIELLSIEGIRECFENGVSPNDNFRNRPLFDELITGYSRGPSFRECVKAFVDFGLIFEDKNLLAVLMDDAPTLDKLLMTRPEGINKKYSLNCAFTPLFEASLLHFCAEFNHLACAQILVKHGADINEKAGIDNKGFGGQTPVFHTVNQNPQQGTEVLKYLISKSANTTVTVKGLIWGKGYPWETFVPAVNPISYAMMGLLPQFQRSEIQIYEMVSLLLKEAYNIEYFPSNVPNRYLQS